MNPRIVPSRRLLFALLFLSLLGSGPASAIQHEVRILLDLDHDAATGCTVATADGPFDGVEQILVATVETTLPPAGTVTDLALRDCVDPATDTFGAPQSFDGGWPAGVDTGVGARDVVESYLPLASAAVADSPVVRLGVVVTDELGGEQALLTVDDTPDGAPILLVRQTLFEIPTLGEWALLLLALLLAAAAVRLLGRRASVAAGLVLLLLTSRAASGAGGLDGLVGDWVASDQLASNGLVLFGKRVADELCFRVDLELVFDPPPTADPQSVSTPEETPVSITLTGSDPTSDPLTFSIVPGSGPLHGSLSGAPPSVTYTPSPDFEGADSFDFRVEDPAGSADVATVSITVTGVNDPPVVVPASFSVVEDAAPGSAVGTVTFADPDLGQSHTFAITAGNVAGAFAVESATGIVRVAAALDFEALAAYTLTVEVTDDGVPVLSGSAAVLVDVLDADDPPVAVDDSATVGEDAAATAIDVLANDTDIDAGPRAIASVTQPANGTVVPTGGSPGAWAGLTYQPATDYCNDPPGTTPDTFTYTLAPGGDSASVSVTVTCVDDPPTAVIDLATVSEDAPATAIDVLGNDTNPDGGPLAIASVTQPANGTVVPTGGSAGAWTGLTYEPAADYCNDPPGTTPDTFSYTLNGGSAADVAVTVTCVNDPPEAGADSFDFVGNTELRVDLAASSTPHALETTASGLGVLGNDGDPRDGDPVSVAGIVGCADVTAPFDCSLAGIGRVVMEANGRFAFVPAPGDTDASEVFQYVLSDGTATTNGSVTLNRFERVWYVDNATSTAGIAGTSVDPFDTLAEAAAASVAGDRIFVHFGDGTSTGQDAGIALKSGQRLLGEHVGLSLPVDLNGNGSPTLLQAAVPGNRPVLADVVAGAPEGVSAVDAIPAEVAGFSLSGNVNALEWRTTAGFGGTGALAIRDNVVTAAGAVGVEVLLAGTGAARLAFHDNSVAATASAVVVQETGAGTLTVTAFDDNTVGGTVGGDGIQIVNAIFDAVPGGAFDTVAGGITAVGSPASRVAGSAMSLVNVLGDLLFTDLDLFATTGHGLRVTGPGGFTGASGLRFRVGAGVGIASSVTGPAVELANLTADVQLATLSTANGGSLGVSLDGVVDGGGTTAVFSAGSGSTIGLAASAPGPAFRVNGGNARVTYGGTLVNNGAGSAVSITNWIGNSAGDDVVFSGAIDENGTGIRINGNGGPGAITFSGGLDIDTAAVGAEGFVANGNSNAGGLNVIGSGNDIDAARATALRVVNTTIGASNLNFRRIASGNLSTPDATSGIVLANTGTAGGLKVTGIGGAAGSGGTIRNTTGDGVSLTGTRAVELSSMAITGAGDDGIDGSGVVGFSLTGSSVTNNGNAADEEGISFTNLSGVVSLTDVTATGNAYNNLRIDNTSGTISSLTVSGGSYSDNQATIGNHGILIEVRGSSAITTASVSNATISGNEVMGIQVATADSGSVASFTVSGNTIRNNELGIDFSKAQTSSQTFVIENNLLTGQNSHGINLFTAVGAGTTGSFRGRIQGNTIGNAAIDGSGSVIGNCIRVNVNGDADADVLIGDNTVRECPNGRGIEVIGRNGTGGLDVTITGNDVDHVNTGFQPGSSDFPLAAILVRSNCDTTCNTVRADVRGNVVPAGSSFDLGSTYLSLVESSLSTLELVDTPPASASCTAQLTANNTGSATASTGCALITGTIATPP